MRMIDGDALRRVLNDHWLATSPSDRDTAEVAAERAAMCRGLDYAMRIVEQMPTIGGWISVKDRLPPNAEHLGSFCPRYLVKTEFGVTEGWYNPDAGCWYTLVWFYLGRKTFDDIDYERGDIPGITDKIEVTHWKEMPELPKEKNDEHND